MKKLGLYKISSISPKVHIGNPLKNLNEMKNSLKDMDADIIIYPELSLTAYSCEDYFNHLELWKNLEEATKKLITLSKKHPFKTIIYGTVLKHNSSVYNVGVVLKNGIVYGIVPKYYIPNYNEFYEKRYFTEGRNLNVEINYFGQNVLVSTLQNFKLKDLIFNLEICEDMWAPRSPSLRNIAFGSHLTINLSASPELVGKESKRKNLVKSFTEKTISAFAYVSSAWTESTKDLVFGGHKFMYQTGSLLSEEKPFSKDRVSAFIDVQKIEAERFENKTWADWSREYNELNIKLHSIDDKGIVDFVYDQKIDSLPFIPKNDNLVERTESILDIQKHGLARRLISANIDKICIGFSGGLDSTWALIVAYETFKFLNIPLSNLFIYSFPGFGTSIKTKENISNLTNKMGLSFEEISIINAVNQQMKDMDFDNKLRDVTYENIQARDRTTKLFNLANKNNAMVLGTGDLSEMALGWCTYNGDHMSHYNVNASLPKTLIQYLVKGYAMTHKSFKNSLYGILDTPISPELLPPDEKEEIVQKTEDSIGPYELHDFFIFYKIKYKFSNEKILYLSKIAFKDKYEEKYISDIFDIFTRRFKNNQYKRDCVPGGPKVGTVSFSPRGDLRMPPELDIF